MGRVAADGRGQGPGDSDALLLARLHASRSGVSPAAGRPGKRLDRHGGRARRASFAACSRASAGPRSREPTVFATPPSASRPAFRTRPSGGVTLIIENHYKDNYWQYPEFAQKMDVFCDLVAAIDSPHFGVNYDPSNTFLAGEDPLELLRRVKHRVVTMHASDRYLAEGTIEDLRKRRRQRRLCQAAAARRDRPGHERLRRHLSRHCTASVSTAGSASKTASTALSSFARACGSCATRWTRFGSDASAELAARRTRRWIWPDISARRCTTLKE